jgi:ribosome biogenesis GTPase
MPVAVRQWALGSRGVLLPTISAVPGLPALGWDDGWEAALAELGDPSLSPARVSRVDRGMCTVMNGRAEFRVETEHGVELAVGDWVATSPSGDIGPGPRIVSVLPRRCVFRRAADSKGSTPQIVAANIDTVLVCDALDGSLSLRHLERFLALAWQSGATPVVLITKSDAVPPSRVAEALAAVNTVAAGVSVLVVSSTTGEGMADLARYLVVGRTIALLGLSGAGKSTLVNLLAGAKLLATGAVRRDGSGRHTTTHRQLVLIPTGGLLIDTPGMRALSVVGAAGGVEQAFLDVESLASACQYANCSHSGEPGCALAAAVAEGRLAPGRLEGWLRLRAEPQASQHEVQRGVVRARKRRKAAKVADRRAQARTVTTPTQVDPKPNG